MKIRKTALWIMLPLLTGCASNGSGKGAVKRELYDPCAAMLETSEEIQALENMDTRIQAKLSEPGSARGIDSTTQYSMRLKIGNNEEKARYLRDYNARNASACQDVKRREKVSSQKGLPVYQN